MTLPLAPNALSELIGDIYDCALRPGDWPDTLTRIRAALGFRTASLSLIGLPSGQIMLMHGSGVEDRWAEAALQYAEDVVTQWGGHEAIARMDLNEPQVLTWNNPLENWKHLPYYTEWIEPLGIVDVVAIGLSRDAGSVGSLGMGRHADDGPVTALEVNAARLLLPHLQRSAQISRLFDAQSAAKASLEATLETLSAAVMLVDRARRILHANGPARDMLAKGEPIRAVGGVLTLSSPAATAALEQAIAQGTENEAGLGRRGFGLPAPRADGGPCVVHVLPLKHGTLRPGLMPSAAAAVFVAPAVSPMPAPRDTLAALFDLTPAEARLLDTLAAGESPPEAARSLGIAANTVKTHLAHIFAKTGTRRQSELIKLAASLAMPV